MHSVNARFNAKMFRQMAKSLVTLVADQHNPDTHLPYRQESLPCAWKEGRHRSTLPGVQRPVTINHLAKLRAAAPPVSQNPDRLFQRQANRLPHFFCGGPGVSVRGQRLGKAGVDALKRRGKRAIEIKNCCGDGHWILVAATLSGNPVRQSTVQPSDYQ